MIQKIAHIENDFMTKFGVPYQSNVVKDMKSVIVFEKAYRNPDILRGLEGFSHIWLIWAFSKNNKDGWSPTVRPPRLGGNTRLGVFATRSPFRPNPLGLSSVGVERIEQHPKLGPVIHVLGADLVNDTPIYDIKPYIVFTDSHTEAIGGFAHGPSLRHLEVVIPEDMLSILPEGQWQIIQQILACDPQPAYHDDPTRVYGMEYGEYEIKFTVNQDTLLVKRITGRFNAPI